MKITARRIVSVRPITAAARLPRKIAWWAYVTVAPLDTSSTVFSRGTASGERASIATGGH